MGMKIRRFSPLPRDLSLEDLIPVDHFYRRLEEALDLSRSCGGSSPRFTPGAAGLPWILWSSSSSSSSCSSRG